MGGNGEKGKQKSVKSNPCDVTAYETLLQPPLPSSFLMISPSLSPHSGGVREV